MDPVRTSTPKIARQSRYESKRDEFDSYFGDTSDSGGTSTEDEKVTVKDAKAYVLMKEEIDGEKKIVKHYLDEKNLRIPYTSDNKYQGMYVKFNGVELYYKDGKKQWIEYNSMGTHLLSEHEFYFPNNDLFYEFRF